LYDLIQVVTSESLPVLLELLVLQLVDLQFEEGLLKVGWDLLGVMWGDLTRVLLVSIFG